MPPTAAYLLMYEVRIVQPAAAQSAPHTKTFANCRRHYLSTLLSEARGASGVVGRISRQ